MSRNHKRQVILEEKDKISIQQACMPFEYLPITRKKIERIKKHKHGKYLLKATLSMNLLFSSVSSNIPMRKNNNLNIFNLLSYPRV